MPKSPALEEELLATQWKLSAKGQRQIEDKGELRSRLGRSPDLADSLSMCVDLYGRHRAAQSWAGLMALSQERQLF